MHVRWCLYLLKKAPRIVSHLIKRSPLSLRARHYQVPSKFEHPIFKHSLMPSSTINDPSSWKYTCAITTLVFPTRIYETRIGEIFEMKSQILNRCSPSFCKAIQIPHSRATLSIAAWTRSLSLLNYNTAMVLRYKILYMICPPSFKAFSFECVEEHLKVSNLIVTNYGAVPSHLHERVQKVREPISSLPSQVH